MKAVLKLSISLLVALAVLFSLARPALAAGELPPPPFDPAGKTNHSASEPVRPPDSPPDQVSRAVEAAYQADAVLRDAHGNPIPLAAKLAVVTLAGNPMACPPGVYPTWLGGTGTGCVNGSGGIMNIISDARVKTNWGVFIQSDSYTETVTINKPINLVGEYMGNTIIHGPVTFNNGNASLNSFTIVNGQVSALPNLTGTLRLVDLLIRNPGDYGVYLPNFKGTAELSNVISDNNGYGAYVDDSLGLGVTITNSDFSSSTLGYGLLVQSKGAVTIENTIASANQGGSGASLIFGKSLVVRNTTFSYNTNHTPDDINGSGLVAIPAVGSSGGITLQNVIAAFNEDNGIFLNANGNVVISHSYFNGNYNQTGLSVSTLSSLNISDIQAEGNGDSGAALQSGVGGATVTDSDFFNNNSVGISLISKGNMVVDYIVVDGNHDPGTGAWLDNSIGSAPSTVVVTNSQFSDHTATGLMIHSKGNVTLSNIRSMNNSGAGSNGVAIDNCLKVNIGTKTEKCSGVGNVTYLGINSNADVFSNGAYGMAIISKGNVTINNFYAGYNGQGGVAIDNCQQNTVSGKCDGNGNVSLTHDTLYKNNYGGAAIFSGGTLTLSQLSVTQNLGAGGVWYQNISPSTPRTVNITSSRFSQNAFCNLTLWNSGNITLNNVSADGSINGQGAFLSSWAGGVSVLDTLGPNSFSGNLQEGLLIGSKGTVALNDIQANNNSQSPGISMSISSPTSNVTITNVTAMNNKGYGIKVDTFGSILLDKVAVSGTIAGSGASDGTGAYLVSKVALPKSVTVTNSSFNANAGGGIKIIATGNVVLNHFTADTNLGGPGLYVDACFDVGAGCIGKGSVSILGTLGSNEVKDNKTAGGIGIYAVGAITVNSLLVSNNDTGDGLFLGNNFGNAPVNLTDVSIQKSGAQGLEVLSHGAITLNNTTSIMNTSGNAARLDNCLASAPGFACTTTGAPAVTITNSYFQSSPGTGLVVNTKGNIILNHVSNVFNGDYGAWLDNCQIVGSACTGSGSVQILSTLGPTSFSYNGLDNLVITSKGVITLNGVDASSSTGGQGAHIFGFNDVVINSSTFKSNHLSGLFVDTLGSITVNKVSADSNGTSAGNNGVFLNNIGSSATKVIIVTQSVFNYNENGLLVLTDGSVTLNNLAAYDNLHKGVAIDCIYSGSSCEGAGNVTLLATLGSNLFNSNGDNGLYIKSNGNVVINKAVVNNNGATNSASGARIITTAAHTVFIQCATLNTNIAYGLDVTTDTGALTLKGVGLFHNNGGSSVFTSNLHLSGGPLIQQASTCAY